MNETTLNTSNVNGNQFGLLFKLAVDDQVWASPLYVAALSIGGVTHNVVYVATSNNTVFAFDADRGGTALWSRNFNNGGRPTDHTEVGTGGFCNPYVDMVGHIGIVGTPVIDSSTNTMYFVARTVEGGGTVQRLHAIDITTDDGKTYTAKVIGTDPRTDVALIKVDGRNDFPYVKLADKAPRIGDWVLAVGNPFGLGGTVTAGIVSARGRDIGAGPYDDFIQIDAPVNKGNSGGPTFDVNGNVIGMNSMILRWVGSIVALDIMRLEASCVPT